MCMKHNHKHNIKAQAMACVRRITPVPWPAAGVSSWLWRRALGGGGALMKIQKAPQGAGMESTTLTLNF